MNVKKSILIRVYISFAVLIVFAIAIIGKIIDLQFFETEKWANASEVQRIRYHEVEASRGNIYAANGELLATSLPRYDVFWDSKASGITKQLFDEKVDSIAFLLSVYVGDKSEQEWQRTLRKVRSEGQRYFKISRNVSYQVAKKLEKCPIFNLGKYKGGLVLEEKSTRSQPYGRLAARTIGYSRPSFHVGIEGSFDSILGGIHGKRLEEKMYGGVWRPLEDENSIEPKDGLDIHTTLDVELQDVAEDALYKTLLSSNAHHGTVILLEVETGAIKALANLQRQPDGSYTETYNYAIGEATDPGSTFKLVSFMAMLEDNKIKLTDSIDTEWGETSFFNQKMIDASKPKTKFQTMQRCFELSSNVGTSKAVYAAYSKNPKEYLEHVEKAHFNKKFGFEIMGEATPRIKYPGEKDWYATTLPWMSIGYEMLVTPLQIATFYNAIANDGKMMKPYIVSSINDADKKVITYKPQVIEKAVCSKSTVKELKLLLEGVVERGTATNLKDLGLKVAGKTGTSQAVIDGTYSKNTHTASFCGYFPAEKPKYTCYVVVSRPSYGVYYGGLIAGPVFREIADKVYASGAFVQPIQVQEEMAQVPWVRGGYTAEARKVLNQLGISSHTDKDSWPDWSSTARKGLAIEFTEKVPAKDRIPSVIGWGLRDAVYILENRGLNVMVLGYGKVVSQSLTPNTGFTKGSNITIRLAP